MPITMSLGTKLYKSTFIERPNRFLLRCRLPGSQIPIDVHLPDPGRLKELLIPGRTIWVRPVDKPERKTKWSAVLTETPDSSGLVSLDSTLPNRLIAKALAEQALEEFAGWSLVRSEYKMGSSRWDFLLAKGEQNLALEVKSVTLVQNRVGLFPDAVTARGAKHLRELAHLAGQEGWQAALLFVLQRDDAEKIHPASSIDPDFALSLAEARSQGVGIYGRKCIITLERITLGEPVPVVIKSNFSVHTAR